MPNTKTLPPSVVSPTENKNISPEKAQELDGQVEVEHNPEIPPEILQGVILEITTAQKETKQIQGQADRTRLNADLTLIIQSFEAEMTALYRDTINELENIPKDNPDSKTPIITVPKKTPET